MSDDFVKLKCKYYGHVNYPTTFSNGEKFPFNQKEKLQELGLRIIKYQKGTRKSFRNMDISIDKDNIKIDHKDILEPIYNFKSNRHYNPWSCIVYSRQLKMIVIMAITRNINADLIITCDVIKFTDNHKKIKKFIEIYQKYFIKTTNNNLHSNDNRDLYCGNYFDICNDNLNINEDEYYLESTQNLSTIYEEPNSDEESLYDDGYIDIGPDNNDLTQPLLD